MQKISSAATFFYKRIFPVLWFGIIGISYSLVFISKRNGHPPIVIFIPAMFMLIFGGLLFKKLLWRLVDAVYDCGDHLLIKDGENETRIPFDQIININCSTMINPSQVEICAHNETGGIARYLFMPTRVFSLSVYQKNPLEELILKVDLARRTK